MGYIGAQPATNFETVRKQVSTTNSGTTITLDYSVSSVQDILVTVNAVVQSYDNYSVSGTTLTLGGTLNNDRVEILYVGRTFQTVTPAIGTVTNDMLVNSSITLNGSAVSLGSSATVGGDNTPAFHVELSANSSVANTTYVKIPFNSELYDTDNTYNTSTYLFTPAVSGKYFIYAQTRPNTATDFDDSLLKIKKNGSDIIFTNRRNTYFDTVNIFGTVEANTTDYFEVQYYQNSGGTIDIKGSGGQTFFGGYKIIT